MFENKVNIVVYGLEKAAQNFDIHTFAIKLVPDMEKMIIVGTPHTDGDDIFVFMSSKTERDKCIIILELVGCIIWDKFGKTRFLQERERTSTSLPTMPTVFE